MVNAIANKVGGPLAADDPSKADALTSLKTDALTSLKTGALTSLKTGALTSLKTGALPSSKTGALRSSDSCVDLCSSDSFLSFVKVGCLSSLITGDWSLLFHFCDVFRRREAVTRARTPTRTQNSSSSTSPTYT